MVRVNRSYALREEYIKQLKRIAIEEGRKLYELMDDALAQYLTWNKRCCHPGRSGATGGRSDPMGNRPMMLLYPPWASISRRTPAKVGRYRGSRAPCLARPC